MIRVSGIIRADFKASSGLSRTTVNVLDLANRVALVLEAGGAAGTGGVRGHCV